MRFGGIPPGNHKTCITVPTPRSYLQRQSSQIKIHCSAAAVARFTQKSPVEIWIGFFVCFLFKKSFRADVCFPLIQIRRNAKQNKQLAYIGINTTVIKPQEIQLPKWGLQPQCISRSFQKRWQNMPSFLYIHAIINFPWNYCIVHSIALYNVNKIMVLNTIKIQSWICLLVQSSTFTTFRYQNLN